MVKAKICGITHEADADLCIEMGADALGLVVEYPLPTPWTLTRARAAELMRRVPPFVSRVAIVGGDAVTILEICAATGPDAVQLHHDEPEAVVAAVAAGLMDSATRVIKAVRIPATQPADGAAVVADAARRFMDAGADAILLDSKTDDRVAGTGRKFEWEIARAVAVAVGPIILAGGLTAQNVGAAIAQVRPHAVDVISAVEDRHHRKRRDRVRAFLRAVRQAAADCQ